MDQKKNVLDQQDTEFSKEIKGENRSTKNNNRKSPHVIGQSKHSLSMA